MPREVELTPGCRLLHEPDLGGSISHEDTSDPDATYETVWIGATRALCWLVTELPEIRSSTVLEIGCGQGLAGLFCAKQAGAKRVVLTDVSESALAMVQKNAKLNGVADRVATAVLDVSKIVNFDERFDYLIASDMLFSTKLAKDVFVACRTFVKPGGTILLGHEKRYSVYRDRATCEIKQDANDEPLELFIGLARQEEWLVHELSPFDDKPQLLAIKIDCV